MIKHYFFNQQIRKYLLQFAAIFDGLQVMTGKGGSCNEEETLPVPILVASKDRVVAAIMTGGTNNKTLSLPTMSLNLQSIQPAPDRRKVQNYIDQRVALPAGGIYPTDLTVVKRVMPVPYDITIELSFYVSNNLQRDQLLEQILVLFNPDLQIQKSDGPFDWTKITRVELTDISNEENVPTGTDRRVIVWTLTFMMPIFLSLPMGVKDDLVRKIMIQIGDLASINIGEVDENGEIVPYSDPLATIEVSE